MSVFVEAEWFGRAQTIGIVLTYDDHDGFKCRMAPLPDWLESADEHTGHVWIMENAAKIPFEWAWGIFGKRMVAEWQRRHLADKEWPTIRYDRVDYKIPTFQVVRADAAN